MSTPVALLVFSLIDTPLFLVACQPLAVAGCLFFRIRRPPRRCAGDAFLPMLLIILLHIGSLALSVFLPIGVVRASGGCPVVLWAFRVVLF